MMNEEIDDILQACLERFAQGETLDGCLQHYPEHADALLPLLQAATQIRQMPRSARPPAGIEQGRAQLRTVVQAARLKKQRRLRHSRFITSVSAFALLLCIVFGLTTVQSANALPSDRLYAWKRTSEQARYVIAWSPAGRAHVSLWAGQRRLTEIKVLLTRGHVDHELLAALAMENGRCWEQLTNVQGREQGALVAELRRNAQAQAQTLRAAAQQTTGITQTMLALSAQKSAAADHPLLTPTTLPTLQPLASAQPAVLTPAASTLAPAVSQPQNGVIPSTAQPTLVRSAAAQATTPPSPTVSTNTALPTTQPTDEPEPPARSGPTVTATATRQTVSGVSPTTTPTSRSTPVATRLPVPTSTVSSTPAHTSSPYPSPPKVIATGAPAPTPSHTSPYPGSMK